MNLKSHKYSHAGDASDEAIVGRCRQGDIGAFSRLVERYYGMVYAIGYSGLQSHEAAEDLAQEVFLRLYLNLNSLQQPCHFSTWASQTARNLATDWTRRRQRHSRLLKMVPLEEDAMQVPAAEVLPREKCETAELQLQVQQAINELPRDQREVLLLHYGENLTQQQIGTQLDMHHTTVGRLLRKAVEALREKTQEWPEASISIICSRGRSRAIARTAGIIAVVASLSAETQQALALAANGAGNLAAHSGTAIPVTSNIAGFMKGLIMLTKTHKTVVAVLSALALAGSYHLTHPGELRQIVISLLDRSTKDHTYASTIAEYMPPRQKGEQLFHGSIGPVDSCVLRLVYTDKGFSLASFDVPQIGICEYPMLASGSPETELRLVATGQLQLTVHRDSQGIVGVASYESKGSGSTTSPVQLKQINEPLPIRRQMPVMIEGDHGDYREYTGSYATGGDSVFVVSEKNGQLFAQNQGQDPLPVFPLGQDRFFYRSVPAEVEFRRDEKGRVNRMTFRRDGRNLPGRKVVQ